MHVAAALSIAPGLVGPATAAVAMGATEQQLISWTAVLQVYNIHELYTFVSFLSVFQVFLCFQRQVIANGRCQAKSMRFICVNKKFLNY